MRERERERETVVPVITVAHIGTSAGEREEKKVVGQAGRNSFHMGGRVLFCFLSSFSLSFVFLAVCKGNKKLFESLYKRSNVGVKASL